MNTNTLTKVNKNKVFSAFVATFTGAVLLISVAAPLVASATTQDGQVFAALSTDNSRLCHTIGDPTDTIVRNGVISWGEVLENHTTQTITLDRRVYHDLVAGCAPTFANLNNNLLTSTNPSTLASGQNATGTIAFNTAMFNCGRVQLDAFWNDPSGSHEYMGTVVDYGHDCVAPTPVPTPVPVQPTPTPVLVAVPRVITSIQPNSACAGNQVSIFGSNLDQTVQAFDSGSARYTTKDSNRINGTLTTVNYQVPTELHPGVYQVRVGPNLFDVSNLVSLTVLNCNATPTPTPYPTYTPYPTPTPWPTPTPVVTNNTVTNTINNINNISQNGNNNTVQINQSGVISNSGINTGAQLFIPTADANPYVSTYHVGGSNLVLPSTYTSTYAPSNYSPTVYQSNVIVQNTPAPTYTPATISIYASPSTVCAGQAATLNWSAANASNVSIDQGIGSVASTGSRTIYPYQTTSYLITAYSAQGQYTSASTTVFVTGSCYQPTPYPTPYPTPVTNSGISVQKFVRNLSRGDASYQSSVTALPGQTVQFEIVIGASNYGTLYNVVTSDVLPAGLNYVAGSARVNNALISDSLATSYGVNVGNVSNASQDVITFAATVSGNYAAGKTFTNVASARADNMNSVNSQPAYVTVQGNVMSGALHVKTGAPLDISLAIAIAAALGITGWYAVKKGMFASVLA